MLSGQQDETKLVRQFRQILLWPLQLAPIREGAQIQEHWELLERKRRRQSLERGARRVQLRSGRVPAAALQRVRHLSAVRPALSLRRRQGAPQRQRQRIADPRLPPHRRGQSAHDFSGLRRSRTTFDVAHVDLCFFYDIDVVILVVEILARDLSLTRAQDTMYRFGRAYPTYWDEMAVAVTASSARSGSPPTARCWRSRTTSNETNISPSVGRYRAPRFASHWAFLLNPLVPDHSDAKGIDSLPAGRVQPHAAARLCRDGRRAGADPR